MALRTCRGFLMHVVWMVGAVPARDQAHDPEDGEADALDQEEEPQGEGVVARRDGAHGRAVEEAGQLHDPYADAGEADEDAQPDEDLAEDAGLPRSVGDLLDGG